MSRLNLLFLGPPRIELDGSSIKIKTRRALALLIYLGVTGESQSRDFLVNLLWPDYDQSRAKAILRRNLPALNKDLPGDWLDVDRETIGLNPNSNFWIDVSQFRKNTVQCKKHGHESGEACPDCVKTLTEAVGLYRDDFLKGFSIRGSFNFDDWQFSEAQSLHSEMVDALGRLVKWHGDQGELEAAIGYARRWLEVDRTEEEVHRHLMEFYARTGRRAAALRQYEECVKILKEELRISPQESTVELYEAIKENSLSAVEPPSPKFTDAPTNNLPIQLTSFIGREGEIQEIKGLLASTRLLTLTGSGGSGKTRLALQTASDLVEEFPDGVWVVELAALSDPSLVSQEVASVLGVREESDPLPMSPSTTGAPPSGAPGIDPLLTRLITYLQSKDMLIIIDNCEHLIEACATLCQNLLQNCPNLKILATSREALGILGETPWNVSPLSIPDSTVLPSLGTSDLSKYEATRLISERAQTILPTFEMTDRNASTVARICHRLDGIPLAIELAAARMKTLSAEEITARLDDRFRLLTGGSRTALPRQQTLRAAIDWSYNLLIQPERVLLGRLSVFMGGWTLAAAESVCAGESYLGANIQISSEQILDILTGLVDKSLVIAEEDEGKTRYHLLETVRQYGRDKLLESGESVSLRDDHLNWFLGLAEEAEDELHGHDQVEWLDRLETEHDNIRAALEWSLLTPENGDSRDDNGEAGVGLAAALSWFWLVRGYWSEGREWLEKATSEGMGVSAAARARALNGAGLLASYQLAYYRLDFLQSDYEPVVGLGEKSLSLAREVGEVKIIASSLRILAIGTFGQQDYARAKALIDESLTLSREIGDKWGTNESLRTLGFVMRLERNSDRGKELFEQSLALSREMGDKWSIAMVLIVLGLGAFEAGDHDRGVVMLEECITLGRELGGIVNGFPLPIFYLGRTALHQGDYDRAKELLEESLTLYQKLGAKIRIAASLRLLGRVAAAQEDYDRALALYRESITLSREVEDEKEITGGLEALAEVVGSHGRKGQAARLYGAAEALRESIDDFPIQEHYRDAYDLSVAALRAGLGEEAFEAVWAEGRAMSMEDAIDYALDNDET